MIASRPAPGAVTLWSNGPPEQRFDLVTLGAGFGAAERATYATQVGEFAAELVATAPFDLLRRLVNLHRVDLTSSEQARLGADVSPGADVPGVDGRLLAIDEDAVLDAARRHVPGVDAVLVVLNTDRYGGSGGRVACTTLHPRAAALAVHELGHAAFHLADEYGQQHGPHPGPQTLRVNVTYEEDPARAPWADLVTPGGSVGCFEGADGYAGGVYRPEETCRMRSLGAPFCAVCAREIRRMLIAHASGGGS